MRNPTLTFDSQEEKEKAISTLIMIFNEQLSVKGHPRDYQACVAGSMGHTYFVAFLCMYETPVAKDLG